jgi:Flp pilus assembly protein TadG
MSNRDADAAPCRKSKPKGRIRAFIDRLRSGVSGNVAMMYALALVPTVGAAGAAVDLGQAMVVRQRLAEATDAAALALGSMLTLTTAQQQAKALEYINANVPSDALGTTNAVTVTVDENTITVQATATVETAFMGLMGISVLEVAAESEVTRESRGMEVVMALDNTGSMGSSGKLPALKNAMTSMINILFGNNNDPDKLKMGLVPFSETVRLDIPTATFNGWIDTTGTSQWARLHFDNNMHPWSIWASMHNNSPKWAGCVEARPNGLEELDTAPNAAQPDTRWVPFFQPDEPDNGSYGNNYLADGINNGTPQQRLMRSAKYANRNTNRPNDDCSMQKILPLTNSKSTLLSYVNGMQASGYTHIAMGAAWGWRVLSPSQPFNQGSAYDDPDWQKVMVLMTDGVNTIPGRNTNYGSDYTAYGYLSEARLGTQSGPQAEAQQNTRTLLVCQRMKALNIRIYTILLMENNTTVRNLMRNCATSPEMFFDTPSASQLEGTFQAIANELSNLRLSR